MKSFPINSIRSRLTTQALPVSLLCALVPLANAHALRGDIGVMHAGVAQSDVLRPLADAQNAWSSTAVCVPISNDPFRFEIVSSVAVSGIRMVESAQDVLDFDDLATTTEEVRSVSNEVCVVEEVAPAAATASQATASRRIIVASGAIEGAVAEFRALLGNPNNGAAIGEQPAGRREINWDGVPVGLTNISHFPANFFNGISPRGLQYQPGLRGLEVSDNSFININPAYAGEFIPFSGQKMFSPLGTNESDVLFFVAGTHINAAVTGFGVVFSDVDKDGTTGIKLLDENDVTLETVIAPARSDARGLSFVGVVFRNPLVTHVHIVAGDARLGIDELDVTQGGLHDLVVMDDFIYGEPKATGK